jgi:UTP--glucose-1-phosphate uridylyltransferase
MSWNTRFPAAAKRPTSPSLIGNEPFGVLLSDDLCINDGPGVLAQMAELYKQFRCSIVAIQEVPADETHKYGVISGESLKEGIYRVDEMVEKPAPEDAPSNLAIIGRYILTPDIFDIIADTEPGANGEIQLTDALQTQARQGCVMAYKFKGRRFDCGSVPGFVEATNYVYEHHYTDK